MGVISRGLLAGAAGTAALNATTYLDMALRGRGASDTPERSIDLLLEKLGTQLPGEGEQRDNRRTALGSLSGTLSGLGVGVGASLASALRVPLRGTVGAVLIGVGAMAATNVPMALSGLTDPRRWSAADWLSDLIPHLAYGLAAQGVLALGR